MKICSGSKGMMMEEEEEEEKEKWKPRWDDVIRNYMKQPENCAQRLCIIHFSHFFSSFSHISAGSVK
jgi:hypothetical protein